jgi:hypothetical protein
MLGVSANPGRNLRTRSGPDLVGSRASTSAPTTIGVRARALLHLSQAGAYFAPRRAPACSHHAHLVVAGERPS